MRRVAALVLPGLLVLAVASAAPPLRSTPDEVYAQPYGAHRPLALSPAEGVLDAVRQANPGPIRALAADGDDGLWIGTPAGVYRVVRVPAGGGGAGGGGSAGPGAVEVRGPIAVEGAAGYEPGSPAHVRLVRETLAGTLPPPGPPEGGASALARVPGGAWIAAGAAGARFWDGAGWAAVRDLEWPIADSTTARGSEDLWLVGERGISFLGSELIATHPYRPARLGALRAVAAFDQQVWVGSANGIAAWHPGGSWDPLRRTPIPEVACLTATADGALWAGTPRGLERWQRGAWRYFAGRRWLPDDRVVALAPASAHAVWVATAAGLGKVEFVEMTLADKARYFEARVEARHVRHGLVGGCALAAPGDLAHWAPQDHDNDGLWTGIYLAAEAFRFAATRDPEARAHADRAFAAMRRLEEITGIPGFPARSFIERKSERHGGGEWHPTPDGAWEWKGDTSSDEIVGHLFAYAVYYDLAADDARRAEVRTLVGRIMTHIVDHGFNLVDLDGKRTTWGVWSPEFFATPTGWFARGLQALEILSHLRVAIHVTGDPKFEAAYRALVRKGYARMVIDQKINLPGAINHSDDELAFLSYYPLFLYEDDPELRRLYLESLYRAWRIERPEKNPLWNFIFAAATRGEEDFDLPGALETLRDIPMDLTEWEVKNSVRADLAYDLFKDRKGNPQLTRPLPAGERAVSKWNGNPYRMDEGGGGTGEDDGSYFLLPYWMGRHHGWIGAPRR